jgi:hypothetical protein
MQEEFRQILFFSAFFSASSGRSAHRILVGFLFDPGLPEGVPARR